MEYVPAIGIDLGTTNTCVAVLKNNKIEIIANEDGCRTIPSVVCFTNEGIKVGKVAKDYAHKYPDNTVYDVKRLLGMDYDDETTQSDIKNWPFHVKDFSGRPKICVQENGKPREYYPEQISSMILAHVKKMAEDFFGESITRAVITVPAYFNNAQRQATKDAAEIARLKVLRTVNEPTAAALAYGWENKSDVPRKVCVYDLGGGTFDVSIVQIVGEDYKVLATSGDTHLGGCDFDSRLVDFLVDEFNGKFNKDLRSNKNALRRLRSKCESAKEKLSFQLQVDIELLTLFEKEDFFVTITRIQFETLVMELIDRTKDVISRCLKDAKLKKDQITDVVLVGGSTRIPKVQEMLKEFFPGKQLRKTINPDEAVAYGAAIQAAILDGEKSESPNKLTTTISDVTSLSLGIAIASGINDVIIPKNTPTPVEKSKKFFTNYDYQTMAQFSIYEGERKIARDNHFLGEFTIKNLPKLKRGKVDFDCTLTIDPDGILHVDSINKRTGLKGEIEIGLKHRGLQEEEVQKLIKEAEDRKEMDEVRVKYLQAHYDMESYCSQTLSRIKYEPEKFDKKKKEKIQTLCQEGLEQLKHLIDPKEIIDALNDLKIKCEKYFQ